MFRVCNAKAVPFRFALAECYSGKKNRNGACGRFWRAGFEVGKSFRLEITVQRVQDFREGTSFAL
jgi:hypothetical protein